MDLKEIYDDYLIIKTLKSPFKIKHKILTELFSSYENIWQVVGITENALDTFSKNNFKTKTGIGINRAHKQDRIKTNDYLLNNDIDYTIWADYFIKHNECVLSTSSENYSNQLSKVYPIDSSLGLFKSSGFAWRHRKLEQAYLQELFSKKIK
jgi:hypothetical protein